MNSKKNQVTRHGAYGVILQESAIFLILKKSGPYKGLWGLPGGAIEFNESPEEALKRELLEETAMTAARLELLSIATSIGEYDNNGVWYQFHHIGIIYKISNLKVIPDLIPEEEGRWIALKDIKENELTPFAKHVLNESSIFLSAKNENKYLSPA